MLTASQVREQIVRFLTNQISATVFDDWITENTWNMHATADTNTQRLVGDVELRIAEFGSGHLSLEEIKKELLQVLNNSVLEFGFAETKASGASSRLIEVRFGPRQEQTGTQRLTAA